MLLSHSPRASLFFLILKALVVIQRNSASAALEFTPACGGTRARFDLSNRKHAFPRILAGLGVIRTRAFADIQVGCCDLYQEGTGGASGADLLPGIDNFSSLIIYGISRIGVSASLGVIQIVKGFLLAFGIRPAFADTV